MLEKLIANINSIKYKFFITILVMVIISSIVNIYLWYTKTTYEAEESAKAYISQILKNSNDNFEVALKDINQIVTVASTNKENVINVLSIKNYLSEKDQLSDNRKLDYFLTSLYNYKYYFSGILVSSLEGREFKTGNILPFKIMKEQKWFYKLTDPETDVLFIPPHYYNQWVSTSHTGYKDMVLSIAKPIVNYGSTIGVVVADVRCDILQDIFNISLKGNGIVLVLNNETGEIIFEPETNNLSIKFDEREFAKISVNLMSDEGSFYANINNNKVLVVYYKSSFTKWTTVGLIPIDKLVAGFDKTRRTILLMSVLFCILIGGAALYMSSLLTKNILKLNRAINGINGENLDITLKIKSKDEIGQLYSQFNHMVIRIKDLIDEIKSKEKQKRKMEIKVLQTQITPHFLYNTLNTIKFLATLQGVDNIQKVAEALSDLLHISMDKKSNFISVDEEIYYIKCYLSIQEYKYSNKFIAEFIIDDEVKQFMVLKLLLQPIVENALIHGIAPLKRQGVILVRVYRKDSSLMLRVQDNGVGMEGRNIFDVLNNSEKSNGIGLCNVHNRIKMNFGDRYGVTILSQNNINTIVEAMIPLITGEEVSNYV